MNNWKKPKYDFYVEFGFWLESLLMWL
jgi:hypothetical protein